MKKRTLQYLLIVVFLLVSAVAASATALWIMHGRYSRVVTQDITNQMSKLVDQTLYSVEQSVDSALLMNVYAFNNELFTDQDSPRLLNQYAIYRTLRYIQGYSKYFDAISIFDERTGIVYDSQGEVQDIHQYYDEGVMQLAQVNQDRTEPPVDRLAYYYRKARRSRLNWDKEYSPVMTAVLSLKAKIHVIINVNLDRVHRAFVTEANKIVRSQTILARTGEQPFLSTMDPQTAASVLRNAAISDSDSGFMQIDVNHEKHVLLRRQSFLMDLDFYVLVSEAEIQRLTTASMRDFQQVQMMLGIVYIGAFILILVVFLSPIVKLLREHISADDFRNQGYKGAVADLSVKDMVGVVITKNRELNRLRDSIFPTYIADLLSELLVSDERNINRILEELERGDVRLPPGGYYTCAIEAGSIHDSSGKEDRGIRKRFIIQRCNELFSDGCGFAADLKDDLIGIACSARQDRREFENLMDNIRRMLFMKLEKNVLIAIGGRAESVKDLPKAMSRAVAALEHRLVFDDNEIIDSEQITPDRSLLQPVFRKMEPALMSVVRLGDAERADEILAEFFDFVTENRYRVDPRELSDLVVSLIQNITQMLDEQDQPALESFSRSQYTLYQIVFRSTRKELSSFLSRMVTTAACRFGVSDDQQESRQFRTIRKVCAYVDAHYQQDLSLDHLGEYAGLNPSYLSTLFKEVTGVSFSTYLENRRLDAAIRMIESSQMRVTEIATAVGYNSANYFSKVFRGKMGLSPEKYRRMHQCRQVEQF